MHNPKVIVIEHETRERMKDLARKSQTYDSFLNELFDSIEVKKKMKVVGVTTPPNIQIPRTTPKGTGIIVERK